MEGKNKEKKNSLVINTSHYGSNGGKSCGFIN